MTEKKRSKMIPNNKSSLTWEFEINDGHGEQFINYLKIIVLNERSGHFLEWWLLE